MLRFQLSNITFAGITNCRRDCERVYSQVEGFVESDAGRGCVSVSLWRCCRRTERRLLHHPLHMNIWERLWWRRGFYLARAGSNYCLSSLFSFPQRLSLFRWSSWWLEDVWSLELVAVLQQIRLWCVHQIMWPAAPRSSLALLKHHSLTRLFSELIMWRLCFTVGSQGFIRMWASNLGLFE